MLTGSCGNLRSLHFDPGSVGGKSGLGRIYRVGVLFLKHVHVNVRVRAATEGGVTGRRRRDASSQRTLSNDHHSTLVTSLDKVAGV